MRNQSKYFAFILALTVTTLLTSSAGQAQEKLLTLENQQSHAKISVSRGNKVRYRILYSNRSSKGVITTATDSTITIENAKSGTATILLKEISSLYVKDHYVGNLTAAFTNFNLNRVHLKLVDGKSISGEMLPIKGDSVSIRVSRKVVNTASYRQMEKVKIHQKGAGALSGLVFGLCGAGVGAAIGATGEGSSSKTFGSGTSTAAGAIVGFILAFPIGAAAKIFSKPQIIQGDQQKFEVFKDKVNKRLWSFKTPTSGN